MPLSIQTGQNRGHERWSHLNGVHGRIAKVVLPVDVPPDEPDRRERRVSEVRERNPRRVGGRAGRVPGVKDRARRGSIDPGANLGGDRRMFDVCGYHGTHLPSTTA